MSMRSLADFMEASPRSVRRLACTATVTGRGDPHVDASARGADFSWPKTGTSGGHQCGLLMAKSADFLVATDTLPSAPTAATRLPSFRKSPGRREVHRPGRGSRPRDGASLRPPELHDD